jgi:hypothetical protein
LSSKKSFKLYRNARFADFIDDKKISRNQLHESPKQYHHSSNQNSIEEVIHKKLLSSSLKHRGESDEEYRDVVDHTQNISENIERITDLLVRELVELVLREDRDKIRTMYEIEDSELEDPLLPNIWGYHKDLDLNKVIKQISELNELMIKEDDIDYGEDDMI